MITKPAQSAIADPCKTANNTISLVSISDGLGSRRSARQEGGSRGSWADFDTRGNLRATARLADRGGHGLAGSLPGWGSHITVVRNPITHRRVLTARLWKVADGPRCCPAVTGAPVAPPGPPRLRRSRSPVAPARPPPCFCHEGDADDSRAVRGSIAASRSSLAFYWRCGRIRAVSIYLGWCGAPRKPVEGSGALRLGWRA
jgi:hypothetical protein